MKQSTKEHWTSTTGVFLFLLIVVAGWVWFGKPPLGATNGYDRLATLREGKLGENGYYRVLEINNARFLVIYSSTGVTMEKLP